MQQTLVIAWRELPSLRDPGRFGAWLQRLLVNASYAWASVIVDGRVVATDCAPDVGWLDPSP